MLIEGINFWEIIFELTIFFLLCVAIYDLSKKYLLPILYEQISSIKKKEIDDKERDKLLSSSKKRIENEIKDQDEKFFLLEKKVRVWGNFLEEEKNKLEKVDENILENVKAKRKKQEANFNLFNTQRIVIPQAVRLSYKEIEDLYSGSKGEELLRELLIKIEPK